MSRCLWPPLSSLVCRHFKLTEVTIGAAVKRAPAAGHLHSAASSSRRKLFLAAIKLEKPRPEWSIVAYNLSEELKIDNLQKLLDNMPDYALVDLPEDLKKEALMLSLESQLGSGSDAHNTEQALHDVFLFRHGSIVFWGVPYEQQKRFLYGLSSLKVDPHSNSVIQDERECIAYELTLANQSSLEAETVRLSVSRDPLSLQSDQFALSHAVAMSVKLAIWEKLLDRFIDSINWITNNMKSGRTIRLSRDQVFRKTGEIYELKHRILLDSDLLDLPDIYWDRHDQERLFLTMASFLSLKKRTAVMNEKLTNCCELVNLLANHINDRHHTRLEWMIITLILVEVLFEIAHFIGGS